MVSSTSKHRGSAVVLRVTKQTGCCRGSPSWLPYWEFWSFVWSINYSFLCLSVTSVPDLSRLYMSSTRTQLLLFKSNMPINCNGINEHMLYVLTWLVWNVLSCLSGCCFFPALLLLCPHLNVSECFHNHIFNCYYYYHYYLISSVFLHSFLILIHWQKYQMGFYYPSDSWKEEEKEAEAYAHKQTMRWKKPQRSLRKWEGERWWKDGAQSQFRFVNMLIRLFGKVPGKLLSLRWGARSGPCKPAQAACFSQCIVISAASVCIFHVYWVSALTVLVHLSVLTEETRLHPQHTNRTALCDIGFFSPPSFSWFRQTMLQTISFYWQ